MIQTLWFVRHGQGRGVQEHSLDMIEVLWGGRRWWRQESAFANNNSSL